MDSLLFALNAVSPIVILVAVGYLLKCAGLMNESLAKACNKLVFRVFLPVKLFLNVYKIQDLSCLDYRYIFYCLALVLVLFFLGVAVAMITTSRGDRRGPLVQVTFRSNFALLGVALSQSLFGDEGTAAASLVAALIVPVYNILAVISLSVFQEEGGKPDLKKLLRSIVSNPLIQCVAAGILALVVRSLLVRWDISFRLTDITPVYAALNYLGDVATPMSLVVLGALFEFSAVSALRKEILVGTLMRTVVAPLLGVGLAAALFADTFTGAHFATFVAVFATPVAVSSSPMAQEMGSDATLAGQLVVWTTILSALSIFICTFLLRQAGIF